MLNYYVLPIFLKFCRNLARIRRNLPEFKIPTHPGRIRKYLEVSGIGTSSAKICIWPIEPLLAHAAALLAFRRPLEPLDVRSGGNSFDSHREVDVVDVIQVGGLAEDVK